MAEEIGEVDDIGPSFTIGPPSEPIPQADLETRYMGDHAGPYSEDDYQSEWASRASASFSRGDYFSLPFPPPSSLLPPLSFHTLPDSYCSLIIVAMCILHAQ